MNLLLLFLYSLAIRFFLFEVELFGPLREYLRDNGDWVGKLLDCSFCNGFWVGLCLFAVVRGWNWTLVPNALLVGYLAFFTQLQMEYLATSLIPAGDR